ncbi:MAG: sulfite exporter TauE/SafE family protein [Paracoccaceae bacterium]
METFLEFAVIGFVAQVIDGALGMGFGVISSSVLLAQGVPPPVVSTCVNAAKLPTGGVAALSHWWHCNPDWVLVRRLCLYGALGGMLGALVLTGLKGAWLGHLINLYLLAIGALIIRRALRGSAAATVAGRRPSAIGFAGGLIEGIGGSWGPIVTTGLVGSGVETRRAVGSSGFSEFVVSLAVFLSLALGFATGFWGEGMRWHGLLAAVLGLVAGGVPAAFCGGWLARYAPKRPLTFAVGALAMGTAIYRAVFAV